MTNGFWPNCPDLLFPYPNNLLSFDRRIVWFYPTDGVVILNSLSIKIGSIYVSLMT